MSVKNGYGVLSEKLVNTYLLGAPVADSNRNAVIQLPSKNTKRIFSISCSYACSSSNGNAGTRGIMGGRLIVAGTKFDGHQTEIIPDGVDLPDNLSQAQIYFDMFIGSEQPGAAQLATGKSGVQNIREHYEFTNGLVVPEGTDVSIILTYPLDDGDLVLTEPQASNDPDGILSTLNVYGFIGGSDQLFKNFR